MQQLTQKLKSGEMKVLEVPVPALAAGQVLVKNYYSLISAGTEGSTVKTARKGMIGKVKERPQQVKQVIDTLKSQGPVQTYRAVMKKLDAHSPLGYSTAGEVIEVGAGVRGLKVGDKVACGGLSASHAEVVAVPQNLCVKLADDADLKLAAYNTLGAIAMQGVRQADLRLGETCCVIGLGLLGQITGLLLKASGVRVIGVDIDEKMVELAKGKAADLALPRETAGIEAQIADFTDGLGCDAVIITAATDSLDPVNFAGAISRKRGTVVIVGAVPTGFEREPHYYKKELQLRMSCSYGPGRYDPQYEEKGIDYPVAYVRWSEQRNMLAFQQLLEQGNFDPSYLTTHVFPLDEAPTAYDMLMNRSEPFVGVLLEYQLDKKVEQSPVRLVSKQPNAPGQVQVGFIGAGSYAQSHLLPNLPESKKVRKVGVVTGTGSGARSVGDRYGFELCSGDERDVIEHPEINTLFIATRHDSHGRLVLEGLKAGKHVFVEKPLCLLESELEKIADFFQQQTTDSRPQLMVGYNRRFAPLAEEMTKVFSNGPLSMQYRINAGTIPADSWIQDAEIGGGRILGEVCHFVDFLTWLNGSLPLSVHALSLPDPYGHQDTVNVSLSYENGSIGTISYLANGANDLPKERVEVHGHGVSAVLDDFRSLQFYGISRKEKKMLVQDKGQKSEVHKFIEIVHSAEGSPIPLAEVLSTSQVGFAILESLRNGQTVSLK